MTSKREDILARIAVVIGEMDGIETSARNLDRIVDMKTPAAILYDGDEDVFENLRATGAAPNAVNMMPTVVVSLGDVPENVGTVSNEWLAKVQRAVLLDETIQTLMRQDAEPRRPLCWMHHIAAGRPHQRSKLERAFLADISVPTHHTLTEEKEQ